METTTRRPWPYVIVVALAIVGLFGGGAYALTYYLGKQAGANEVFVWRRFTQPFFGDYDGHCWLFVLVPVLILAGIYVVWMYVRDGQSIGWFWGTFLAGLRLAVYAILTVLFLMPAWQVLDESITRFKVIVLFDVSRSMSSKDEIPSEAVPVDKILTRQDKVRRLLDDEQVAFLTRLNKNPLTLYRFGLVPDPRPLSVDDNEGKEPAERKTWLTPDVNPTKLPDNATAEEREADRKQYDLRVLLVNGTNVADSILSVMKREASNQPQGIIVFSDGRSTQVSSQAIEEIRKSKVSVFTVGIGEYREPVKISIVELVAPPQIQPDMSFPIVVEVDGEGKPDEEVIVTVDIYAPRSKDDPDADKDDPKRKPALQLTEKLRFKPGVMPHGHVEFPIDPAKLPPELLTTDSGKPELLEGKWIIKARVPRDKRETFKDPEHVSRPVTVQVVKKPMRVLLFAGGPTREYQFTRTLLVREATDLRAELSICLQNARPEVIQDVKEDRMLKDFPDHIGDVNDPNEKADDKYLNFLHYDVIVAFDPDWTKLTDEQIKKLETWVDKYRGGLIVIGGPVYTNQLNKINNLAKVKPLLDLLPVVPDYVIRYQDRSTTTPWRINFRGATPEMEFLKLDEESQEKVPLAGWEEFFTGAPRPEAGRDLPLKRGFYDFFPLREVKTSATIVATYGDPHGRTNEGKEHPYLVVMPYGSGQHNVVWVGSGETWRLRQFREAFHERFWVKLIRYAGAGSQTGQRLRGYITPPNDPKANKPIVFNVRADGKDLNPLPQTAQVVATVKALVGDAKPIVVKMKPRPLTAGETWKGVFDGRIQLPAGDFQIEIPIPGTTDKLDAKFTVDDSNLEMDNTRPDFIALRGLASSAKGPLERVGEEGRSKLEAELERTNRPFVREGDQDQRLYFDLKAAEVIPEFMTRKPLPQISRGPVKDVWDWSFLPEPLPKVSLALVLLIGLFSVEWLTRKLLRLA